MSNPTEPGRTGRGARARTAVEAPPSDRSPEDEPAVTEAEAEPSVTEGIYFAKAPARDVWHGYDEDHEPIGTVYRAGDRWHVKANRVDLPSSHGSATAARAFLAGYALGRLSNQPSLVQQMSRDLGTLAAQRTGTVDAMPGTAVERSTDATHDADAGLK